MGCRKMLFCCPYYESNGRKILHCEGGQLSLPDRGTRRQYYNEYCGDVNGWRRCTVARAITRFYEAEE